VSLSHQFVEITLVGVDSPQADDLHTRGLGHVGDREGLLMDIQADVKHARLGYG
jgi:hypothetical protein